MNFFRLAGPSSHIDVPPQHCVACGGTHLFQQPDFRRQLGLWVVGLASASTFVLLYFDANWFVVWSPMLVALILDRLFNAISPTALICYTCQHIHRGLDKKSCRSYETFDLETQDRLNYSNQ